jgi:hypothetical protein
MGMNRKSKAALASTCIAVSLAAGASSASGAVTIGETGPVTGTCGQNSDWAQQTVTSGNPYVVPSIPPATSLHITSWSHEAFSTANQQIKFRVYRQVMGLTYRVVGQDIHSLTPSVVNTFSADVPVSPGDILGISNGPNTPNMGCGIGPFNQTDLTNNGSNTPPGLAIGDSVTFTSVPGSRLDVSAVVEPVNAFTIAGTIRNKKKGNATLTLNLPNPGELTVSGTGVAETAAAARSVPAGAVALTIQATGKKRKKLKRKGKAAVAPTFTYTPTGGATSTQSTQLTLKKKSKKKH